MKLSDKELATVLAALRYWQQDLANAQGDDEGPISPHFEDVEPLSAGEIDDLCERLNVPSQGLATDQLLRLIELAEQYVDGEEMSEHKYGEAVSLLIEVSLVMHHS